MIVALGVKIRPLIWQTVSAKLVHTLIGVNHYENLLCTFLSKK
ncbi:Predicted kinase [Legionella pneumophila 2300/99 Alcoy]|nr:Predicted kinase [Legionella pneumophila 2300/99 Alcoy]